VLIIVMKTIVLKTITRNIQHSELQSQGGKLAYIRYAAFHLFILAVLCIIITCN